MAVKKPVTVKDVKPDMGAASPTEQDQVEQVVEATAPEMVAEVDRPKYVKVKNPFSGAVSEVPSGIVDSLLDSGYTKSR